MKDMNNAESPATNDFIRHLRKIRNETSLLGLRFRADVLVEAVFRLRSLPEIYFLCCHLQCRAHRFAALTADLASIYAILHVSELLAALGARAADLSAGAAYKDVLGNSSQQYRSRCVADFRTCDHQSEMIGFDVFSA